jgi:hypothetical protein
LENKQNVFELDDLRIFPNENSYANNKGPFMIDLSGKTLQKKLFLFNSNLNRRDELISVRVNTPYVELIDDTNGSVLKNVQISLVWPNMDGGRLTDYKSQLKNNNQTLVSAARESIRNTFELLFKVEMNGLDYKSITVRKISSKNVEFNKSEITFYGNEVINNPEYYQKIEVNKRFVFCKLILDSTFYSLLNNFFLKLRCK